MFICSDRSPVMWKEFMWIKQNRSSLWMSRQAQSNNVYLTLDLSARIFVQSFVMRFKTSWFVFVEYKPRRFEHCGGEGMNWAVPPSVWPAEVILPDDSNLTTLFLFPQNIVGRIRHKLVLCLKTSKVDREYCSLAEHGIEFYQNEGEIKFCFRSTLRYRGSLLYHLN